MPIIGRIKHLIRSAIFILVTTIVLLLGWALVSQPMVKAGITFVNICDESTFRNAINIAVSGDTISFNCSGTITLTTSGGGTITIAKNLTLDGGNNTVILSGGDTIRLFSLLSGVSLNINKLTIANGYAGSGGGIYNQGTLTVTNSIFSGIEPPMPTMAAGQFTTILVQ